MRPPLQTKPGWEANVNSQRKRKTNDNWFRIQPKYLFHEFSLLLASGSLWVWKEEELRKKGKFAEEKTKEMEHVGGKQTTASQFAEGISDLPVHSQNLLIPHTARCAFRTLPFSDIVHLFWGWPEQNWPHDIFQDDVVLPFPSWVPKPRHPKPFCFPNRTKLRSQIWQSQPFPIWDSFWLKKKKKEGGVERKTRPLLE